MGDIQADGAEVEVACHAVSALHQQKIKAQYALHEARIALLDATYGLLSEEGELPSGESQS